MELTISLAIIKFASLGIMSNSEWDIITELMILRCKQLIGIVQMSRLDFCKKK